MTCRPFPALLLGASLAAGGCSSVAYYSQSVGGQLDLWWHRQAITDILADDATAPELKTKLQAALAMRDFASRTLKLPDNDSYRGYTDLQRSHVVWNVFAAPEFSLDLKKWCFPFAGCVGYKGYFAEQDALDFSQELRTTQGLDVYVGGVDAYSTLGWFDDPLLNTIINRPPQQLAGLIFHELAHQEFYVKDDTAFNESFASTVELEGVKLWLEQFGDDRMKLAHQRFQQQRRDFLELIKTTQMSLREIYLQATPDAEKRAAKSAALDALNAGYAQLKARWLGYGGYDKWFQGEINNAKLGSIAVYTDWVPAFQQLLANRHNDFTAFYRAVRQLGELDKEARHAQLQALLPSAQP